MPNQDKIPFDNGCILEINPILRTEGVKFLSCRIQESILGKLPDITLIVQYDKNLCKVNDPITGSLTTKKGNKTEFKGYIYSSTFALNTHTIKILCVEPDFVKKIRSHKYTGMDSAVKGLYKGEVVSNAKADALTAVEFYQKNLSNYKYLKKILFGYKIDTIFGFALGDLRINDLKNWEPKIELAAFENLHPIDGVEFTDPVRYGNESELVDFTAGVDALSTAVKFHTSYSFADKAYQRYVSNVHYNSRLLSSKSISNYMTRELFPIDITDSVKLKSETTNTNKCFIASRVISFEANKMEVFYAIQSIDPLGE